MKINHIMALAGVALALSTGYAVHADTTNAEDTAWAELKLAAKMPGTPAEWKAHPPTREQISDFSKKTAETVADKAADFVAHYPDSAHAVPAMKLRCEMLKAAVGNGDQSKLKAWDEAQQTLLKDTRLTDDDRFGVRVDILQRERSSAGEESTPGQEAKLTADFETLLKDYPHKDKAQSLTLSYAANSAPAETTRSLLKEILAQSPKPEIQGRAEGILRRLDAVGKPLDIQFTAVDGTSIDFSQFKGKVVLVDFWATWCGPCMAEVPHVREAYSELHDKGFEIVGLSFDSDKEALLRTLKEKQMTWPQYFDGKGWGNQYGLKYGIMSIPTMWLVDKQGNLRDVNGREDLKSKVEKLLAE